MLVPLIKSARPHQWVKNLFVAAPLVFARLIGDWTAVSHTTLAVATFCLLSSAVYLINDIVDVAKDRAHPVKRNRPIASGKIPLGLAKVLAPMLGLTAMVMAVFLGPGFASVAAAYLALNLGYSLGLKKIAFVDVGCISLGFLLRVLAGSVAIPVQPSKWLLVCTLLLSALLGFGKRTHELRVSGEGGSAQRDVLGKYELRTLQRLMVILAVLTSMAYLAYTQSEHALTFFGHLPLVLTVPFVVFGIFRFTWITSRKLDAESPTDSMLRDWPFVLNLVLYAGAILLLVTR
ncbi:MAG: decaprenyl-phosphate phosphoribosyltransferase [Deltaproteobacteria bacterium]|nr:decaprenyl-phosphate phosphoribosyltransferase [Deltaproteobacteria bacterium]